MPPTGDRHRLWSGESDGEEGAVDQTTVLASHLTSSTDVRVQLLHVKFFLIFIF